MPKISIITTTYKHKDFISYTIDSIISQTFTDWELLIWDDSPENSTWDIIQEYVAKYPNKIKAWYHSPNKWIVDNLNFLIEKSSNDSEFIAFLEWDDTFDKDYLKEKLEIFEKYEEVKLVYNDLDFIDKDNKIILKNFFEYRKIPFYKNSIIKKEDFIKMPAGPIASWSTCMIRKKILEKYKITNLEKENKRYSISDYDFYFRISTQNKVYWIEKSLTKYRRHSWNLSWSKWWTSNDLDKLMDYYFKENIIDEKLYNYKKSWTKIVNSIFELEIWNKKNAINNLLESLKYNTFSFSIFKLAIIWFIIIPKWLTKVILKNLIKRW